MRSLASALLLVAAGTSLAGRLAPVGVVGNSGIAGETLLRIDDGITSPSRSGAAFDGEALWLSGGRSIQRVGLDGRLIDRYPVADKQVVIDSRCFALWRGHVFCLGRVPATPKNRNREYALLRLTPADGARVETLPVVIPERKNPGVPPCLSPHLLRDQLAVAVDSVAAGEDQFEVLLISPKSGDITRRFAIQGQRPRGVDVDSAEGTIYIGGYFGLYVAGARTHHAVSEIIAVDEEGRPRDDFRARCTPTPAIPSEFRGLISLTPTAIWDTAWYGFLARLDRHGRPAPGRVAEWRHELNYPTQVVPLAARNRDAAPLVIATSRPESTYFAIWHAAAKRLELVRRLGCLPDITSIGLSRGGRIAVGCGENEFWWDWRDSGDAPPRIANIFSARCPPLMEDDRCFAFGERFGQRFSGVFRAVSGRGTVDRHPGRLPFQEVASLSVQPSEAKTTWLFVLDARGQLWKNRFELSAMRPVSPRWTPCPLPSAPSSSGSRPASTRTEIAALADGRLLLAQGGEIAILRPEAEGFRMDDRWSSWGAGDHFGNRLRFSLDGSLLAVSDTDRHRALVFDWQQRRLVARHGETDRPGDDAAHLNAPAFISLRGQRLIVADTGNQRVVKLELEL